MKIIQSSARELYCDYNSISVIYSNSNMAMLRVRDLSNDDLQQSFGQ